MPSALTAEPDLLTPGDVARLLGVTRVTVYRWVAAGHLRAYKLGPAPAALVRIERGELERFLRRREPE